MQFELPKRFPSAVPRATSTRPKEALALRDALLARSTDTDTIDSLLDACMAARSPFKAECLGGGLWRASHSRGKTPRWQKQRDLLPRWLTKNRAGQAYAPRSSRVVNYGEILGKRCYFTAEGSFSAATRGARCPQDFNVLIERGGLVLLGKRFVSSAISGKGFLRVRYIDEDIRIFESPNDSPDKWEEAGLVVVQVRDALFDDAGPFPEARS
jgi:hypothetical protein